MKRILLLHPKTPELQALALGYAEKLKRLLGCEHVLMPDPIPDEFGPRACALGEFCFAITNEDKK